MNKNFKMFARFGARHAISVSFALLFAAEAFAANPITTSLYTADPAAMVYHDSLFVFTGHDEQGAKGDNNKWFLMRDWHVFVTGDMEKYHDYGAVLSPATFKWASGNAFAGQCEYHNGKFYWFVAVSHATIKEDEGFSIGVAVADHPSGPWKDAIGAALITDKTPNDVKLNIDPAIFVDNGQVWLYWGSWGAARRVKLKDNMKELAGSVETVKATGFFEAPWVHKYRGNYYFSYASGYPSTTNYSISSSLAGPWTNKGVINALLDNSETNHQAIVKYLGHWYFIYHAANAPGGWTYRRSVNIDYLYYDKDANILPIVRTTTGVDEVDNALVKDGVYRLAASHSGLVLGDAKGIVTQQTKSDSENQQWILKQSAEKLRYYSMMNLGTKKYFCTDGLALLDTVKTKDSPCEFRIENASAAKGYYLFANYDDDFVGDILNVSKDANMPLIAWVRSGEDNQKFKFEYVSEQPTKILPAQSAPMVMHYDQASGIVNLGNASNWALFDISGKMLLNGVGETINVRGLNPGLYLVKSRGQSETIVKF